MKRVLWFLIIPGVLLIYSVLYNVCNDTISGYLNIPLYNLLNVCIAVFFAYYLTQMQNNRRKKLDIAESVLKNIYVSLSDNRLYQISDVRDLDYIRITQRTVKNQFGLLEKLFANLKKELNELKVCKNDFSKYWDFISNNINDLQTLSNSQKALQNDIFLICDALEKIRVELYIEK